MRRLLAVLPALLLVALFGIAGAPVGVVAGTEQPNRIVDYETIFGSMEADGTLKNVRLVDQLRIFGQGAVTVTDPMSTQDFRNLLGEGDADVQDNAVVWNISELSGVEEFITASTPDVDPPLGMVVTYFRDGERVEADDLIGKSGSIDITFDVSNLTSKPMEISYEDGSGNTLTAIEQVPVPMVAELSLELPKGTFTEVEAPLADIVTQPDGDLTVRWSMVLVPPIGETVQSFNLNAMTDGFELGAIRLAGVPVAPKDRPFLAFAEEEFAEGTEAAGGLYSGSSELAGNIDDLHDGTLDLLDGLQQLLDGSKELAAGLVEAADGSGQLTDGAGEARAGSAKLTAGLGDALDGSGQITGGLGDLRTGLNKLLRGLKKLAAGLPDAASGANQMAAALTLLDVGLAQIKAGLGLAQGGAADIQAGAVGIQAIAAGLAASLSGPAPSIKAGADGIAAMAAGLDPLLGGASAACAGDPDSFCSTAPVIPGPFPTVKSVIDAVKDCLTGSGASCGSPAPASIIAGGISQGAVDAAACLTGGGLPCSGNPSVDAIAGQIAGGAALLVSGLGDAIAGIGDPSDAPTASIRGGIEAVRQGALLLVAGIGEAIAGLGDELTENTLVGGMSSALSGAKQLAAGSAELTAGLGEAHAGSGELTAGLVKIEDGSGQLTDGLNEAADGSGQIADGLGQAKGGAGQIEQGVYLINEVGVREISRSASQAAAEIDRKLALMEAQDGRAAAESLLYGPPSSDQAEVVVGGSGVVLTMDALNRRGDDSVARGVGAGVGFALLGGLTLVFLGLRRRVT